MTAAILEKTKKQYTYEDYEKLPEGSPYQQIYEKTGVKEYWIVDPMEKGIEIYENVSGEFKIYSQTIEKGIVESKLLKGFGVELEKVF